MRRSVFLIIVFCMHVFCYAQCWLGVLKNDANMFSEASSESDFIIRVKDNSSVLFDKNTHKNGFYYVYSVDDKLYGYINARNIKLVKEFDCDDSESIIESIETEHEEDESVYDEVNSNDQEDESEPIIDSDNDIDTHVGELWIGYAKRDVNLRTSPSTNNVPLTTIPAGSVLAFDITSLKNGFYYVCYIDKDMFGYVSQQYIGKNRVINEEYVELNESSEEDYSDCDPELHIKNDANVNMTLRVNNKVNYPFKAHEERTITVPAGTVSLRASSPGVIPFNGTSKVEKGYIYDHVFYLKTIRMRK